MIHFLKALVLISVLSSTASSKTLGQSAPWQNKIQQVPGRIEFEYYDEGGEGVAYHDFDSTNNGSGKLNPPNGTFLNEFRMKEGVDMMHGIPLPGDNGIIGTRQILLDQSQ